MNMQHASLSRHSEISTPFPAQHPFTSHISKFAVFPETQPYQFHPLASSSTSSRPSLVSSATQTQPTDLSSYRYLMPRPTAPFYVLKKASENNVRVERCHHLEESEEMISNGATLWDLPRSQRHMVSKGDKIIETWKGKWLMVI